MFIQVLETLPAIEKHLLLLLIVQQSPVGNLTGAAIAAFTNIITVKHTDRNTGRLDRLLISH